MNGEGGFRKGGRGEIGEGEGGEKMKGGGGFRKGGRGDIGEGEVVRK